MNDVFGKSPSLLLTPRAYLIRLSAGVLAINLFVAGLAAFFLYKTRQQDETRVAIQTQNLSQSLSQTIAGIIDKTDLSLLYLKREMERQLGNGKTDAVFIDRLLLDQRQNIPELDGMRVADALGDVIYLDRPDPQGASPQNISADEHFRYARDHAEAGIIISKPLIGRHSGKWQVNIDRRINYPDGSFAGIVFGSISLDYVSRLFASFDIGKLGVLTLRSADLTVVVRYPDTPKSSVGSKTVSHQLAALVRAGRTSGTYRNPGSIDPVERIFAFNKVAGYPLYVTCGRAPRDYLAPWQNELHQSLLLAIFTSSTFMATWLLYRNRKRISAADALVKEYDYLLTLFEHNGSGHLVVSPAREIVQVNQYFCELFGYEKDELIGKNALMLHVDREHYENWAPVFWEARDSKARTSAEYPWRRKDGSVFWCIFTGVKLALPNGDTGVVWNVVDITERKEIEEALRESEELFRSIMALSPDIISIISAEGVLLYNSPATLAIHGYTSDDLLGRNTFDCIHPDDQARVAAAFQDLLAEPARNVVVQFRYRNKNGGYTWMEATGSNQLGNPVIKGIVAISRNIEDRKQAEQEHLKLEKQFLHAQKLESLGILAGGIAHDFNNLLTAIMGNIDLAMLQIPKGMPVRDNLEKSMQASRRAADLTRQMLAYAGKGVFQKKAVDLNEVVVSNTELFRTVIPRNISLNVATHPNLPRIMADPSQLQQIVMNLITNAAEAIGPVTGFINLATGATVCDQAYIRQSVLAEKPEPGMFVFIEVEDNGVGMNEEIRQRLFDPFFTTKFTGRGLGMAGTQGIVKAHGGMIILESEEGKGTMFRVLFPVMDGEQRHAEEAAAANHHLPATAELRRKKILIVDDEDYVRSLVAEYAKHIGYEPVEACNGAEAIDLYKEQGEQIGLVILDLTMPVMDGVATFFELKRLDSEVRVLLTSGYSEQAIVDRFPGEKPDGFLRKPFQGKEFVQKLRQALP